MKEVGVGIIGTGWCGGIRAETCAASPYVRQLHIAEIREERLKDLMAGDKKDSGLVFDELGIDQIFIDEIQMHKNLATASKMDRVAGVPGGGSTGVTGTSFGPFFPFAAVSGDSCTVLVSGDAPSPARRPPPTATNSLAVSWKRCASAFAYPIRACWYWRCASSRSSRPMPPRL